jgi:hypothetical protein
MKKKNVCRRLQNMSLKKIKFFTKIKNDFGFFQYDAYGSKSPKMIFFCIRLFLFLNFQAFLKIFARKYLSTIIAFGCRSD